MLLACGRNLGKIAKVAQHQLVYLIARREILLPFSHHLVDENIEELDIQQRLDILL
ncbi:hypothetical protein D3C85_1725700 [compost metagenome]